MWSRARARQDDATGTMAKLRAPFGLTYDDSRGDFQRAVKDMLRLRFEQEDLAARHARAGERVERLFGKLSHAKSAAAAAAAPVSAAETKVAGAD